MFRNYGGSAAILIGIFGLVLIWQGITGNVMRYPHGDLLIPRWMYVLAGIVLLTIPFLYFFLLSDAGLDWLGFQTN